MSNIGRYIAKYRKASGITQDELGARLHVTRQTVSSWENGRTLPGIDMLSGIAGSLNVSIEQLIYGVDTKKEIRVTSVYKKIIIVTAVFVVASATAWLLIKPYRNMLGEPVRIVPELLHWSILPPIAFLSGILCFLSITSLLGDIALRNNKLRFCLLAAGIFMLLMYIYFIFVVYSILPGGLWAHNCWMFAVTNPIIFMIPGAALFFGINRSVKRSFT